MNDEQVLAIMATLLVPVVSSTVVEARKLGESISISEASVKIAKEILREIRRQNTAMDRDVPTGQEEPCR